MEATSEKQKKYNKILITTAIDYANAKIHIGHAYEKILADSVARYYRKKVGEENVYFVTGTDVHGTTNEKAAAAANEDPYTFVQKVSDEDQKEIDSLNVSYDRFIRTTDADHIEMAKKLFKQAVETGAVYKGTYEGYYCEGCENHKTLHELDENGQCPMHPTRQIQKLDEENYFFKWSDYSEFLTQLIQEEDFLLPERKRAEMLALIENGLPDKTVSRPKYKVSWGIETPTDPEQVIYVWYDALINYYTATKSAEKDFWSEDTKIVHFVGKDIVTFHSLLWPAMLKNLGLKVPDTVYGHGFLNLNGQKISKSRGNVIYPQELVEKYGADSVRYYFLKFGPIVDDVDISIEHLEEIYNADLANGLGNSYARLTRLAEKSGLEFEPQTDPTSFWTDTSFTFIEESYRVDLQIAEVWKKIAELDKHINDNEPWAITDKEKLFEILSYELEELRSISLLVEPFVPEAAKKMQAALFVKDVKFGGHLFPRKN